jgi:anti-anti-sigma factor
MSKIVKVWQPAGILDAVSTNILRSEVVSSIQDDTDIVLVDLQDVTFMNSSGIGALMATYTSVKNAGKHFYICSLNDQIKLIFELTQVDLVFPILADREEFARQVAPLN